MVLAEGSLQVTCCRQRLVQVLLTAHTFGVPPPPQLSGSAQVPHWMTPPQPSPAAPQFTPRSAQVMGVHGGAPQTLATPPPPQVSLPAQVPQARLWPQPSSMFPQSTAASPQVRVTHEPVEPELPDVPPVAPMPVEPELPDDAVAPAPVELPLLVEEPALELAPVVDAPVDELAPVELVLEEEPLEPLEIEELPPEEDALPPVLPPPLEVVALEAELVLPEPLPVAAAPELVAVVVEELELLEALGLEAPQAARSKPSTAAAGRRMRPSRSVLAHYRRSRRRTSLLVACGWAGWATIQGPSRGVIRIPPAPTPCSAPFEPLPELVRGRKAGRLAADLDVVSGPLQLAAQRRLRDTADWPPINVL